MPDISISYNGSQIASMDASGTKTLLTSGMYCEDDITVQYVKSSPSTYNGEHHQPVQNYTVTISLTNPVSPSSFSSCNIYSLPEYDETNPDFPEYDLNIGSINSATGSTNVSVNPSWYGFCILIYGVSVVTENAVATTTGGVSVVYNDTAGGYNVHVTGNGSITIDGIDYDD